MSIENTSSNRPPAVDYYTDACQKYGVKTDTGVLIALRFGRKKLRVTDKFRDKGMLPLADVMLHFPPPPTTTTITTAATTATTTITTTTTSSTTSTSTNTTTTTPIITVLDFSHAFLTSHGAIALGMLLKNTEHKIQELHLQGNKIGSHGARAVAQALCGNQVTKLVNLRGCWIGERGAMVFARQVLRNKLTGLEILDLSINTMGFQGMQLIERALHSRKSLGLPEIKVDLEGNAMVAEVMSCVTHGLGMILCIIGTVFMGIQTYTVGATGPSDVVPAYKTFSVVLYCISISILYTASTLYHSFFALTTTRAVFHVFDHSAIYILIAGSYSPLLGITFPDKEIWSLYLQAFMWFLCACGIYIEARKFKVPPHLRLKANEEEEENISMTSTTTPTSTTTSTASLDSSFDDDFFVWDEEEEIQGGEIKALLGQLMNIRSGLNQKLSLAMYLGMGWAVALVLPDLVQRLHGNAIRLLLLGGLCYTGGVPFFVRNRNVDHAVWHMFVLAGSIAHYFAIYLYVIPLGAFNCSG